MCPDEDPRGLNWSVFRCSVSNKTLLTRSSVFVPASRSSAWSLFIPVVCFFFNSTCVLLESGGIKSVLEDRCLFFTSNWHFPTLLVCFFNRLKTTAGQSLQMWSQIMSSLAELYLKFSLQRNQIRWMSVKWCAEYLQAEEDKSLLKTETNLNQRLCWTGSEHRVASFVSLEWNHPCVRAGAPARFCDGGLHGGRLAGSIWLIAPPWQWATLINGRPELFVRVCALCCVWGPRCRISMWEHEATAVTLTRAAAAAADERVFTLDFRGLFYCTSSRRHTYAKERIHVRNNNNVR